MSHKTKFKKSHDTRMFYWGHSEAKRLLELGEPKLSIERKLLKPNLIYFNQGVKQITYYPNKVI